MSYYYRGSRPLVPRGRCTGGPGRSYGGTSSHYSASSSRSGYDSADILEVKRPSEYSGNSSVLSEPEVIGCYSVGSDREFGHDPSMIRFLRSEYIMLEEEGEMKVRLDLNKGAEQLKDYIGHTEESFGNLLQWILNNEDRLEDSQKRLLTDFISVKRNFIQVMKTPYEFHEWKMCASSFKGCVYIKSWKQELENAHKKKPEMEAYEKWGHTFEEYVTGKEGGEVDPNEEYRCALKTSVGEYTLLYAPKLDCADPGQYDDDFKDLNGFVSIKCCKKPTEERKINNHKKFNLMKYWSENKLCGIPRTLVGYRDEEGIVKKLEMIPTEKMPEMGEGLWDPNVCVNFLEKFLKFVKERVMKHPGHVFIFEHEFRGHIYCKQLPDSDDVNFLPEWYTSKLFARDEEDKVSDSE